MASPQAGPSNFDDSHEIFQNAKDTFEKTISNSQVNADITVRRRRRGRNFIAEDILYEVNFSQSHSGNVTIISALISIYHVIIELVRSLKRFYSNKKLRLCFFSVLFQRWYLVCTHVLSPCTHNLRDQLATLSYHLFFTI